MDTGEEADFLFWRYVGEPPRIESAAAVSGIVTDASGRPVQGAAVRVTSFFECTSSGLGRAQVTTDEAGRFEVLLKGVPVEVEGCVTVVVEAGGEHGGKADTTSGIPVVFDILLHLKQRACA